MKKILFQVFGLVLICNFSLAEHAVKAQMMSARQGKQPTAGNQPTAGKQGSESEILQLLRNWTDFREERPVEKLYLHTDKQAYAAGETIWLKAYAVIGVDNYLSNLSRLAWVELIDPKSTVVSRIRIPLIGGTGIGDFSLQDTLIEGSYRLRAYTTWMRNDHPDYFFEKNIAIGNGRADNILSRSRLETNEFQIDLQNLDDIGLGDTEVRYEIGRAGSVLRRGRAKTNALGQVSIPYRNDYENALLSIVFENAAQSVVEKVFKLPAAPDSVPRIQFFPEGGDLLLGTINKLAVKSLRPDGTGIASRTAILSAAGDTLTIIRTNPLGMGSGSILAAQLDTLWAHTEFEDGTSSMDALPLAVASGYSATVNNLNTTTLFAQLEMSEDLQDGKDIYFVVHHLGKVFYASKQPANRTALIFSTKKDALPNGVLTITFLREDGRPLIERPIFVYRPENVLSLSLEAISDSPEQGRGEIQQAFGRRKRVQISVESGFEEDSLRNAFLSASVVHRPHLHPPTAAADIQASLLLSNDIRGYIQQPDYYFHLDHAGQYESAGEHLGKEHIDFQGIDDLLMTQGWRKIDWSSPPDTTTPPFAPEKGISIKGQTRRFLRKQSMPEAALQLIRTDNFLASRETESDAQGYFEFSSLAFPDSVHFILSARDKKGGRNIDIIVEEPDFPPVGPSRNAPSVLNDVNSLFRENLLHTKQYFAELESKGFMERSITLREVEVRGGSEKKVPDNSSNFNGPGRADQVLTTEDLSNCSSLDVCLNGLLMGVYFKDGAPYNTRTNGQMQVVLDGMYIESDELSRINPNNVASIEVLRSIIYTTSYGMYGTNGVIVITTRIGADPMEREVLRKGIVTLSPQGFHVNKTFYKPAYERDVTPEFDRDLRTTIHWEPVLFTDSKGRAAFDFYTGDEPGSYQITLEGVDLGGRIGRRTMLIQVR